MKYCSHCGKELLDEAIVCPNCGCAVDGAVVPKQNGEVQEKGKNGKVLRQIAYIFALISTVLTGFWIIPLLWQIPMTIKVYKAYKEGEQLSVGFKVCCLLFLNTISGILLLCDEN